jgi:hypothetical protein
MHVFSGSAIPAFTCHVTIHTHSLLTHTSSLAKCDSSFQSQTEFTSPSSSLCSCQFCLSLLTHNTHSTIDSLIVPSPFILTSMINLLSFEWAITPLTGFTADSGSEGSHCHLQYDWLQGQPDLPLSESILHFTLYPKSNNCVKAVVQSLTNTSSQDITLALNELRFFVISITKLKPNSPHMMAQ